MDHNPHQLPSDGTGKNSKSCLYGVVGCREWWSWWCAVASCNDGGWWKKLQWLDVAICQEGPSCKDWRYTCPRMVVERCREGPDQRRWHPRGGGHLRGGTLSREEAGSISSCTAAAPPVTNRQKMSFIAIVTRPIIISRVQYTTRAPIHVIGPRPRIVSGVHTSRVPTRTTVHLFLSNHVCPPQSPLTN